LLLLTHGFHRLSLREIVTELLLRAIGALDPVVSLEPPAQQVLGRL
jgi:hypothetical protein